MDCENQPLSCRLEDIANAIGTPTPVDELTLWVAAASAVGTMLIASLNVVLLYRQHLLSRAGIERESRIRRAAYAHALNEEARSWAAEQLGHESRAWRDYEASMADIARLGALSDEPSHLQLRRWFIQKLDVSFPNPRGQSKEITDALREIVEVTSKWEKAPRSVESVISSANPPEDLGYWEPTSPGPKSE